MEVVKVWRPVGGWHTALVIRRGPKWVTVITFGQLNTIKVSRSVERTNLRPMPPETVSSPRKLSYRMKANANARKRFGLGYRKGDVDKAISILRSA